MKTKRRINEAGMSLADIMKHGDTEKAKYKDIEDKQAAAKNQHNIRQIRVQYVEQEKRFITFDLMITYTDGKTVHDKMKFSKDPEDKFYKQIKRGLRAGGNKPSMADIYLSMLRVSFEDRSIEWVYGGKENEYKDQNWLFTAEAKKLAKEIKYLERHGHI